MSFTTIATWWIFIILAIVHPYVLKSSLSLKVKSYMEIMRVSTRLLNLSQSLSLVKK